MGSWDRKAILRSMKAEGLKAWEAMKLRARELGLLRSEPERQEAWEAGGLEGREAWEVGSLGGREPRRHGAWEAEAWEAGRQEGWRDRKAEYLEPGRLGSCRLEE